jgi:hypothetical protein
MLSTLHLGGRNSTGTEIKLSKISVISVPYPPQVVRLWFQGNGSHVQWLVSQHGSRRWAIYCFYPLSFAAFSCFVVSSFQPRLPQRRNMPL